MKAINCDLLITSLSAKKDRSLGLRIETPELSNEEKVMFMELQNVPLTAFLQPKDGSDIGEIKIDKELHRFSQSQRIRNKLFRLWEQDPEGQTWDEFYYEKTEKIISYLDGKLR